MTELNESRMSVELLSVQDKYFVQVERPGAGVARIQYSNRAQAEVCMSMVLSRAGKPLPADDVTYNDFYDLWINEHVVRFCSPIYLTDLDIEHKRFFRSTLGEVSLAQLELETQLVTQLETQLKDQLGRPSVYTIFRGPRAAMNTAIRWGFITSNPVKSVR